MLGGLGIDGAAHRRSHSAKRRQSKRNHEPAIYKERALGGSGNDPFLSQINIQDLTNEQITVHDNFSNKRCGYMLTGWEHRDNSRRFRCHVARRFPRFRPQALGTKMFIWTANEKILAERIYLEANTSSLDTASLFMSNTTTRLPVLTMFVAMKPPCKEDLRFEQIQSTPSSEIRTMFPSPIKPMVAGWLECVLNFK